MSQKQKEAYADSIDSHQLWIETTATRGAWPPEAYESQIFMPLPESALPKIPQNFPAPPYFDDEIPF